MFTKGQVDRMRTALTSYDGGRAYLWSDTNLTVTGVSLNPVPAVIPVPDFLTNTQVICKGGSITFKDYTNTSMASSYLLMAGWNVY